jgi:hypothetical protein
MSEPDDNYKKLRSKEGFEEITEDSKQRDFLEEPIQVEEVDRLKAENLNLKLLACVNRETILQQQLNELGKERQLYNEHMQAMQATIEEKYGINLRTHHILPDSGMVVSRIPASAMGSQSWVPLKRHEQQNKE